MASKRRSLCIDEKVLLIRAIQAGENVSNVGRRFGFSRSTVSTIWKNKEKILQAEDEGRSSKKLKKPKYEDLDRAILSWVHRQRQDNMPISGPIMKAKAKNYAEELGLTSFKASEGWLGKFKQRHHIKYGLSKTCSPQNKPENMSDLKHDQFTIWVNPLTTPQSDTETRLEVCIDGLESALNAVQGGADEIEVCSSLTEGGLTPSPGLVKQIIKLVKNQAECDSLDVQKETKVNIMIRCRGGSDFCYTEQEINTMLADIEVYKNFGVDRFVFGALTDKQDIDIEKCKRVIEATFPLPVTFHRAFDLCREPNVAIQDIIKLGFSRILTSGQKSSAADEDAQKLLKSLFDNFNDMIEIMPGAGVNCDNANVFVKSGFKIIHSSCKKVKLLPVIGSELCMGSNEMYVTDVNVVRKIKEIIRQDE